MNLHPFRCLRSSYFLRVSSSAVAATSFENSWKTCSRASCLFVSHFLCALCSHCRSVARSESKVCTPSWRRTFFWLEVSAIFNLVKLPQKNYIKVAVNCQKIMSRQIYLKHHIPLFQAKDNNELIECLLILGISSFKSLVEGKLKSAKSLKILRKATNRICEDFDEFHSNLNDLYTS